VGIEGGAEADGLKFRRQPPIGDLEATILKIDNFSPSADLQSTHIDKTQQTENTRSQPSGKKPVARDFASISSLAQQIAQGLQADSSERIARVEQAQKLYLAGGINVPPGQVADSLILSAVEDTAFLSQVTGPSAEA
jgi:anti-sigma28 factor (negative regulator of flagellin synthesis)